MATIHPDQVAVRFADGTAHRHRCQVAEACHLMPVRHREEVATESFTIFRLAASHHAHPRRRSRALFALARHRLVEQVNPVYRLGRNRWLATDRIAVKPKAGGEREIDRLVRRGATIVRVSHGVTLLELPAADDAERVAAALAARSTIEFAEPDYVILGSPHGATTGSTLALAQIPYRLIGAAAGWRARVAKPEVVVAILDCGVLTTHPDLAPAMGPSYDATTGRAKQEPNPWNSHGTACAGLAGGVHAGAAGVKGVAAGCGLMSVRIGYTPTRDGSYVTKSSWIQRGIDWAWEHGAAVLNMSFGGGPRSSLVAEALTRARTKGRAGRGTVLVASAGNGYAAPTPVEFPATLPWVLSVAATDNHDRPKSTPDNNEPWVSASGARIDIAAPGVNCYSTTVPDPAEGETALYVNGFSGTSAATPLVAGAAALVVSANPALSEEEVRRLLCRTAKKVSSVRFVKGHNDWVGSGRLDVAAAVRAALASSRA